MIILGLNCFHGDSSAAIVRDGTLVAAAEEERFRRIKHWAGFPAQATAYCLAEARISLAGLFRLGCDSSCAARGGKNNSCRDGTAPAR